MARLVVTAVLVEGRSKSEVARSYGVSRRWVITLVARFLAEGEAGLAPRSRRPLSSPHRTARAAAYLRDNVKYGLGSDEAAGLQLFLNYAADLGLAPGRRHLEFF